VLPIVENTPPFERTTDAENVIGLPASADADYNAIQRTGGKTAGVTRAYASFHGARYGFISH
jgi:hypothetical protein